MIIIHLEVFAICKAIGLGKILVDRNISRLRKALLSYKETDIAIVVTRLAALIAFVVIRLAIEFAVIVTHLAAGASRKVDGLDQTLVDHVFPLVCLF